jgi:cytochrome P450
MNGVQAGVEREAAAPLAVARHHLWGHLVALRADPLAFLMRAAAAPGALVPLQLAHRTVWLVKSPDAVHHVFHDNASNYSKSNAHYRLMRLLLGDGLLTSTDDMQQERRRAIRHDLLRPDQSSFAPAVDAALTRELRSLRVGPRPARIDVSDLVARLTLAVVGAAVLRCDLSRHAATIHASVSMLNRRFGEWSVWSFLPWMPTPDNLRCWQSVRALRRIAAELLRETGVRHADRPTLSDGLERAARLAPGAPDDVDSYMIDELVTLIVASYETTALATTWALWLLAHHAEWQERIADELVSATESSPRGSRALALVLHETLRLYPPVWMMSRTARDADVIAGHPVRRGGVVLASPYVVHRLPELWEAPESFRPSRFEHGVPAGAGALAYCPFGAGDRSCIGGHIALSVGRAVLARLVRDLQFTPADTTPVRPAALATLYPSVSVMLNVSRR